MVAISIIAWAIGLALLVLIAVASMAGARDRGGARDQGPMIMVDHSSDDGGAGGDG